MNKKEMLYDNATQALDKCVDRNAQRIKNCLRDVVYHAYNKGLKDGRENREEHQEKPPVRIGDVYVSFPHNALMIVTGLSEPDAAIMLFEDGHTENCPLDALENENYCIKTDKQFDIREVFKQLSE